jgi:hypothetical protein
MLVGLVQGVAFYLITVPGQEVITDARLRAAMVIVTLIWPTIILLSLTERYKRAPAIFGLVLAMVMALLYVWTVIRLSGAGSMSASAASLLVPVTMAIICYVSLPFFQVWLGVQRFRFPYPELFDHAWSNIHLLLVAGAFSVTLWGLLWLLAAMFSLVGIGAFDWLFQKPWFFMPVTGLASGFAVALAREREGIIRALKSLVFALLTALGPILAIANALFLLVLPVTGLEPLWRTGRASVIMLLVIASGNLLINSRVGDGRDEAERSPGLDMVFRLLAALLPVNAVIALHAQYLRIDQYGFMPSRVYALVIAGVATVYAFAYCYAVLRHRGNWKKAIRGYNPVLAVGVVAVAILTLTPVLDPYRISAESQLARLRSGEAKIARFDFGALRFKLYAPGNAALDSIRSDQDLPHRAEIDRQLEILDSWGSYDGWTRAQQEARGVSAGPLLPFSRYVLMVPETLPVPDAVVDVVNRHMGSRLIQCRDAPLERCAIVAVDLIGGKEPEYVFVLRGPEKELEFRAFGQRDSEWALFADWSVRKAGDDVWNALLAGDFETRVPDFRILTIGKRTMPYLPN